MNRTERQINNNIFYALKRKSLSGLLAALVLAMVYYYPSGYEHKPHAKLQTLPASLSGQAVVHDGDTIKINGQSIRLEAIDAPEIDQTCQLPTGSWQCGIASRDKLKELLNGREVTCNREGNDKYGRFPGYCTVGNIDVNGWMVANGYAIAYRHFSTKYARDEDNAKMAGRGIWQSNFIEPYQWRQQHKND